MRVISRDELKHKLERADDFALVEVSPAPDYEREHLPMALNVPLDHDFEQTIQQVLPNKNQAVVVYCGNAHSDDAAAAAKCLDELGYRDVMNFSLGKTDWLNAGLRVEQSRQR